MPVFLDNVSYKYIDNGDIKCANIRLKSHTEFTPIMNSSTPDNSNKSDSLKNFTIPKSKLQPNRIGSNKNKAVDHHQL